MKATDLPTLVTVSRPTIHPDGSHAIFATSRPNLDADKYVGQLWRVPLDGSTAPQRVTRGISDSAPRFSPDGSRIGFLRNDGDSPPQLHIVDADGGEPFRITDALLGVTTFRWSPDGRRIAYTARVAEDGRYGTVKDLAATSEPPRRITAQRYQSNGVGYNRDRRNHLFLVEVPDPAQEPTYPAAPSVADPTPEAPTDIPTSRQLTDGDFDDGYLQFSPDGSRIGFISARHADRESDLANAIYEIDLDRVDADSGTVEPYLVSTEATKFGMDGFTYATTGAIYFVASDLGPSGKDFVGRNGALYRLARDGSPAVRLTDPDRCDLSDGANELLVRADGTVLALNTWQGSVGLVAVQSDGGLEPIVSGVIDVHGFDCAAGQIAVNFSDANSAGDIAVVREVGLDGLSNFSTALLSSGIIPAVEVSIPARDGYPVHGWVLTPAGEGPHPVLLTIHGGPYTQYTGSFFDEAQVYADAGYAVVMCNPRGSSGYGQEHGRAIQYRMGTLDLTDVLDFLDGAIADNPSFDASRVGIMGGSYGGYLTAWTIAHDHRFAGAIVERGFLDPVGFVGTSDIGDFFGDEYTGTDPEQVKAQSPQAVVGQVTTPTLILHSENDLRCPLSQGQRYYAALKQQGVEAELLIFPGENHELSRSGQPRHRLQRFEAILDWWQRYLPLTTS
ncbi:MAG: S9 family peptidase [Terrimesophilobacter sp.]